MERSFVSAENAALIGSFQLMSDGCADKLKRCDGYSKLSSRSVRKSQLFPELSLLSLIGVHLDRRMLERRHGKDD